MRAAVTGPWNPAGSCTTTPAASWHADAVILAVPAPRLARLVADLAPRSVAAASRIGSASSVVVALAVPADTAFPQNSGVLVASGEPLHAKAITLSSRKWGARGDVQLLRLSFGRFGEDLARTASDDELLAWAADDLAAVFGLTVDPVDVRVQRWIDAMPQYGPGHADLVARCGPGCRRGWPWRAATWTASGCRRVSRRPGARSRPAASGSGTIGVMAKLDYDALNSTLRYLMFSVFSVRAGELGEQREAVIDDAATFFKQQEERGVVVRGLYDVAGLRADADFMIWTHAERVEALQATYADFRRTTALGRACSPVWSSVALHRPAEFNKSHIPAFLAGEEPGNYICVYPFVRSYEWYLLPDEERRRMLAEHGMAAREYKDVRANTVPAFALGDYEWILAFEAPELDRIVDLMRELRATDARRHTREETPFFTGPRVPVEQLVNALP